MKDIPTKINKYNVYNDGDRLLGMGDEMSLPDFEASSETITGAGILGEIDDPTVGYFGNQEIEIPFRLLDKEAMSMMDMTKAVHLTIRGACQSTDSEGNIAFRLKLQGAHWNPCPYAQFRLLLCRRQIQKRKPHGHIGFAYRPVYPHRGRWGDRHRAGQAQRSFQGQRH